MNNLWKTPKALARVALCLSSLTLYGCATFNSADAGRVSSGRIGCPEDEIQISDMHVVKDIFGLDEATWTTTCRGKRFFCHLEKPNNYTRINCAPEVSK